MLFNVHKNKYIDLNTEKIMILSRYRYRPVTAFGLPLRKVTVFGPFLPMVTLLYGS